MAKCTQYNRVCQLLATSRQLYPVSSINKTDWQDITEILLNLKCRYRPYPLYIYTFFTLLSIIEQERDNTGRKDSGEKEYSLPVFDGRTTLLILFISTGLE